MFSPDLFPFSALNDVDLVDTLNVINFSCNNIDHSLKTLLSDSLTDDIVNNLEFSYYTPSQLNNLANKFNKTTLLSIFHVHVRCLNANFSKLFT